MAAGLQAFEKIRAVVRSPDLPGPDAGGGGCGPREPRHRPRPEPCGHVRGPLQRRWVARVAGWDAYTRHLPECVGQDQRAWHARPSLDSRKLPPLRAGDYRRFRRGTMHVRLELSGGPALQQLHRGLEGIRRDRRGRLGNRKERAVPRERSTGLSHLTPPPVPERVWSRKTISKSKEE